MLKKPVCTTCGTQFPADVPLPSLCPICNDDRQYIKEGGQNWVELDGLNNGYTVKISMVYENLYEFKMEPDFAIGQRAFLVISPGGNIFWDCIPLLDETTITFIKSKGGIKAIAFSHPHYYSSMNVWAAIFNCPIYIHKSDKGWIMYKSNAIKLWNDHSISLWEDISIVNIGGHFPGSSVLYVPFLSAKGTILCGDSLYIAPSKRHIAVMHSYPNQIMLTKSEFATVYQKTAHLQFDTLHGAFEWQNLTGNAKDVFVTSIKRYMDSYEI